MNRRTFITTAAAASVAGCAGLNRRSGSDGRESATNSTDQETARGGESSSDWPAKGSGNAGHLGFEKTHTNDDSIAVTFGAVRLSRAVRSVSGEVYPLPDDEMYVLIETQVTNRGSSPVKLPSVKEFHLWVDDVEYHPSLMSRVQPGVDIVSHAWPQPFYEWVLDVPPGDSVTGWTAFPVPADTTSFELVWSDLETSKSYATWQGQIDPTQIAQLEIESLVAPDEPVNGGVVSIGASVTNRGPVPGLFYSEYDLSGYDRPGITIRSLSAVIEPGETKAVTEMVPAEAAQERVLSVGDDHRQQFNVVPATRSFGSTYETHRGVGIQVGRPVLSDTMTVSDGFGGSERDTESENTFAIFSVKAWNPTESARDLPRLQWFEAEANGSTSRDAMGGDRFRVVEPVESPLFPDTSVGRLAPGESTEGLVYFYIPADALVADVTFRVKVPVLDSDSEICEWNGL